jgi:hypothetical protein
LIDGDHVPDRRAGVGVESNEAAVDGADVDFALIERDATIHNVAGDDARTTARNLRVETPQYSAAPRIERVDDAPLDSGINHTIDDKRCGFEAANGPKLMAPDQAESLDVLFADLLEWTEPLLIGGRAVQAPVDGISCIF